MGDLPNKIVAQLLLDLESSLKSLRRERRRAEADHDRRRSFIAVSHKSSSFRCVRAIGDKTYCRAETSGGDEDRQRSYKFFTHKTCSERGLWAMDWIK